MVGDKITSLDQKDKLTHEATEKSKMTKPEEKPNKEGWAKFAGIDLISDMMHLVHSKCGVGQLDNGRSCGR